MVTRKRLKEALSYDSNTGIFKWKIQCKNQVAVGSVAGTRFKDGRRSIWIDGKQYYAHRLAWLYERGEWPQMHIDHIDGDPSNNRISNLRDVTRSVNLRNQYKAHKGNRSGLLGVTWYKPYGKWLASIRMNGKSKYLGYFENKFEAYEVYLAAKKNLHR